MSVSFDAATYADEMDIAAETRQGRSVPAGWAVFVASIALLGLVAGTINPVATFAPDAYANLLSP